MPHLTTRAHQAQTDHHARDVARQKHVQQGQARGHGGDDHREGGGDDGAQGAGRGDHGCREVPGVVFVLHRLDHGRGDGRRIGHGRTGDAAHDHAGQNRHHGEAAPEVADQGHAEVHRPFGDPPLAHDVADQDEARDGQQGEGVHADHHLLGDGLHGQVCYPAGEARRESEAEEEGQSQKDGDDEGDDDILDHRMPSFTRTER